MVVWGFSKSRKAKKPQEQLKKPEKSVPKDDPRLDELLIDPVARVFLSVGAWERGRSPFPGCKAKQQEELLQLSFLGFPPPFFLFVFFLGVHLRVNCQHRIFSWDFKPAKST